MEKIKRELSNSVADFDIIQLKDKISKAETVEAVRDVVERTRGAELLRTMENARILSEVLKLSKQSDNPMMTPVPDRKICTYAHLFFYGKDNCYSLIRSLVNLVKADKGPVVASDASPSRGWMASP